MQFEPLEQWIWLPDAVYPNLQKNDHTFNQSLTKIPNTEPHPNFAVVRCEKSYGLKPIDHITIRASADNFFRLRVNGVHVMTGPASVGGDFVGNARRRPQYYATKITVRELPGFDTGRLDFSAMVRMEPVHMFEFSMGHGGFFLTAQVRFQDGTKTTLRTDESWLMQHLPAYRDAYLYDGSLSDAEPVHAQRIANRWHCLTSPIPPMEETPLFPESGHICLAPGEKLETAAELDKIYSGYGLVNARCSGEVLLTVKYAETNGRDKTEEYRFFHDTEYLGTRLHGAGVLVITAENRSSTPAELEIGFLVSHYPVTQCAKTVTSDADLNLVLDVCTHTLDTCRQTIHLDSGSHCEALACTGDYYIESLMTALTFGDLRLAAFDVRRTAQLLRYNNGRMFHTTYSLIWIQMLWDVYRFTGETELLCDCEEALTILLERFAGYVGENGLIETPPDYMFIDWLIPDGISTHHPPKALGQTCMCLFYYGGLKTAAEIYDTLSEPAMAAEARKKAAALELSIPAQLYDPERGLFFEGLNTPTREDLVYHFMPQNVEKRYYRKHANILAAYFGILDKAVCRSILTKVMADDSLGEVQPYFAHFLFEAIYRCGLRNKYTLALAELWKAPIKECPKGLAEGFYKPEPTYTFDHSHAWGGSPAYSVPLALTGLTLLEPGWKTISLSPSLLGLEEARTELPTPYGMLVVEQKKGREPVIALPDGITLVK